MRTAQIHEVSYFSNGKKNGISKFYYESGKLLEEKLYTTVKQMG